MGVDVIDIRKFASINSSKEYFLDTNVLYWYCYPRITGYQMLETWRNATNRCLNT